MSKASGRFWYFSPWAWKPGFWRMLGWPYFGGDEWGRNTIVMGTFFTGYLVWAYRNCPCDDCVELRLYNKLCDDYGEGFADEVLHRRVHLRELQRQEESAQGL